MRPQCSTVDQRLARLAERQHAIVTYAELLGVGLSAAGIQRRVRKGALHAEYRGVYCAGHRALTIESRYMAAVKACGESAVLSGRAAAYLFSLLKGRPPPPEVTATKWRRVPGVVTHRSQRIHATRYRSIPVVTVPWVLVDVAGRLVEEELARACHEAQIRYRTKPEHIEAVLEHRPNAPGARKLRRVMNGETAVLLSELERRFLRLLKANGLPLPQTNRKAGAHFIDCRWPEHRLTVELDSYRFHNSRYSWEQDYKRERDARRRRKDEFRRYTWADVFEDPAEMLAELKELLTAT